MVDALIGHTGFVGGSLLRQRPFDARFRSTDIADIGGQTFDTVVCAGAPAQKWIANREPLEDARNIERLIRYLDTLRCTQFVLISTVDVFKSPNGVDEDSPVDEAGLHPYGLHRRHLEQFVERRFPNALVVRLPGLVGPGLRKNALFDLHNGINLAAIDRRAVFQFYPMVNLWNDIQIALGAGLRRIHLTAEPISIATVARLGFGRIFRNVLAGPPAAYDMTSRHASLFGGQGGYQYGARESLLAIRAYAQSEPRQAPAETERAA